MRRRSRSVGSAYTAIDAYLAEHHRSRSAPAREVYLSDPTVPEDRRVTLILQPVSPV